MTVEQTSHRISSVSIYAGGRIHDAIRIANIFAGERGGIATLPELVEATLTNPMHPVLQGSHHLTSSIAVVGRVPGRAAFRGLISHTSGAVEEGDGATLFDGFKRATERYQARQHLVPGPNWNILDISRFLELFKDPRSFRTFAPNPKKKHDQRQCRNLIKNQMHAVLGSVMEAFLKQRGRVSNPPHKTSNNRSMYDRWRRGNPSFLTGNFELSHELLDPEFCHGAYALMAPLAFNYDPNNLRGSSMCCWTWPNTLLSNPRVFAWRDRSDRIGETVQDPQNLELWKLDRRDCFHPTEEALPASDVPFFIFDVERKDGEEIASKTSVACATHQGRSGEVQALFDPLCRVEITEVLGKYAVMNTKVGAFTADEWATIVRHAPSGTRAIRVRMDSAEVKPRVCACCEPLTVEGALMIEYLRVRPMNPNRYLTVPELLSDPYAYLRHIGAID